MIRSCYTDQFNLRQPYKVGILTVPTFQMRTSEAPSMRRAGPRSHSEEVKESVRSVCLQHRCTKHWASLRSPPSPQPPRRSLPPHLWNRSTTLIGKELPGHKDMKMRRALPRSRKRRITLLPWKQVAQSAQASHLLQLQSRIMSFNFRSLA